MNNRLPLAPGSRWDGNAIVEDDSARIWCAYSSAPFGDHAAAGSEYVAVSHGISEYGIWPENIRAILHANGYLPEVYELAKLREAARKLLNALHSIDVRICAEIDIESLLPKEDKKDG